MLVDSPTSPYDDDRECVRGERGYACEGDSETRGDIGAIIPSLVRDDDRRRAGTMPNSNRGSEEREGGMDVTEGEFTGSREPSWY